MNEICMSYEKCSYEGNKGLKPDKDGYYRVRLGGVNVFNSNGIFYKNGVGKYDLKANIINDGKNGKPLSFLNQAMMQNSFFGEAGHPNWEPGYTEEKFYERNLYVDPKNIAFLTKRLYWVETNENVDKLGIGGDVVWIEADILPTGTYGEALRRMLEDDKVNVSFSIRALVDTKIINGITVRILQDIIAWDWVAMPGIAKANKFDMLADKLCLEHSNILSKLNDNTISISRESMSIVLNNLKEKQSKGMSLEGLDNAIQICENYVNVTKYDKIINWKK